jgi:predicted O-methyltransferase YrrM
LALDSLGGGALTSIDMPYPGLHTESYVGIAVPERLKKRWTLIRRPDRDVLKRLLREQAPIDLAHYDSDKSRPGRNYAYPLLWESLRPGGVLISDDISDNTVFDEFSRAIGQTPIVIRKDAEHYVGVLTKP